MVSRRGFLKLSLAGIVGMCIPRQEVMDEPYPQLAQDSEPSYDVILNKVGTKRLDVLRAVREISGASINVALYILNKPGTPILRGWSLYAAEIVSKRLESLGASVQLAESPFLMWVEDVFRVQNRGIVVTGTVARGIIKVSDTVEIIGLRPQSLRTTVIGIEKNHISFQDGKKGDKVGLLLRNVVRNQVERGMAIAKPGTLRLNWGYPVELYVLRTDEGGKHQPVFNGYKPQFRAFYNDVTGTISLSENIEMLLPGDTLWASIAMTTPCAFEPGTWIEMRDGGVVTGIVYLVMMPPLWMLLP